MNRALLGEHALPPILVLAQVGLGLGGRFLDRPNMMVLVPGKCGATRERLLAVSVRALVGALPGVNATMSGQ